MKKAALMNLDFDQYFEPQGGINTPREFTEELIRWSLRESRHMVILEEAMEPIIELDSTCYICRLGEPGMMKHGNFLQKALHLQGVNHSVGKALGYKWVYLYKHK